LARGYLNLDEATHQLFVRAYERSLSALSRSERRVALSGLNSTRSLGQIRGLSGHAAGADCAA
jgi:hypothetical protein